MSKAGAFYVDVELPDSGVWYFSATFVYQNGSDMREGMGNDYMQVNGYLPASDPILWDYSTTKKFRGYPLPANQIHNTYVDVRDNQDPNGYEVSIVINQGVDPRNLTINCTSVLFSIKDKSGNPATTLVPYLDAAAHVSFVAEQDAIYHGHAMFSPDPFSVIIGMLEMSPAMNMNASMISLNNTMAIEMMNAMMIGLDPNGTFNCLSDEAKTMAAMDMNMNEFYGPPTYGPNLATIFDFPNYGNWRIWLFFAIINGNGTDLVVADFAAYTNNPYPPPPVQTPTFPHVTGYGSKLEISFFLIMCLFLALYF